MFMPPVFLLIGTFRNLFSLRTPFPASFGKFHCQTDSCNRQGIETYEDIADELRGADYLVWRNGRGAVRLLGRENNLMLLEYAGERMLSRCRARRLPGDRNCSGTNGEAVCRI